MRKLSNDAKMHVELNKAYLEFNPQNSDDPLQDKVIAFSNYLKNKYGLELRLFPNTNNAGQQGYEVTEVYVIDESKFTFFLLQWT